jgi:hypothetical protein
MQHAFFQLSAIAVAFIDAKRDHSALGASTALLVGALSDVLSA